ncbi:MAG: hypothetical protein H0U85_02670, partial [Gemmatimonadales bacterium]|nr:hypothetical protein [Gemmatimonadales bacterium]
MPIVNTAPEQRPDHGGQLRPSRRILQVGALACVLASLPSPLFDLDRHQVPKEVVLHAVAGLAAV